MAKFSIAKWRKQAISLYGKSRGLTKTQRAKVTAKVHSYTSSKSKAEKPKRRVRSTVKKKRRRRGGRIFGNVGWKGLLAGIIGLAATKYVARRFLPVSEKYVDGAAMVGIGALGKAAKLGTASMLPAGIAMLGSSFLEDLVFGGGMGFVSGAQASYDL